MVGEETLARKLDELVEKANGQLSDKDACNLRKAYLDWIEAAEKHLVSLGAEGADKVLRLQTVRLSDLAADRVTPQRIAHVVGAEASLQRQLWDAPSPELAAAGGTVPGRWVWLIDVVYAGVLVFGFQQIEHTLFDTLSSPAMRLRQGVIAGALVCFFLYDVTVYHLLVARAPYRTSRLSACRYLLDILMTFLLQLIIVSASRTPIARAFFVAGGALAAWHICAAIWHLLASRDHNKKPNYEVSFVPHLVMAVAYAVLLIAASTFAKRLGSGSLPSQPYGMYLLCVLAILFGIWRSGWLIGHPRAL